MKVFEQLQAASFKGFSFLVESEQAISGKKVVLHEYPNSNKRFAEELGVIPLTFNIPAIVHGDINLRRRFEQLLKEPGLGTLVHPIYGTVDVIAGEYSVSSNQSEIGQFRFNLSFYRTEENITPSIDEVSGTQITSGVDAVSDTVGAAFTEQYIEPTFVDSVIAARDKVDTFFATMQEQASALVDPVVTTLSAFNTLTASFRNGITTLVQNGENLKNALESTFLEFSNLVNYPEDLADAWNSIIDFGFDDEAISNTTIKRTEISTNNESINDYVQIQALARSYEAAVYTSYKTDVELNTRQETIEDNFKRIMVCRITPEALTIRNLIPLQADVRSAAYVLRTNFKKAMQRLLQNVWRVVTISPGRSSLFLTTFRYYGNFDNLDLLSTLNPEVRHSCILDSIKAVAQ